MAITVYAVVLLILSSSLHCVSGGETDAKGTETKAPSATATETKPPSATGTGAIVNVPTDKAHEHGAAPKRSLFDTLVIYFKVLSELLVQLLTWTKKESAPYIDNFKTRFQNALHYKTLEQIWADEEVKKTVAPVLSGTAAVALYAAAEAGLPDKLAECTTNCKLIRDKVVREQQRKAMEQAQVQAQAQAQAQHALEGHAVAMMVAQQGQAQAQQPQAQAGDGKKRSGSKRRAGGSGRESRSQKQSEETQQQQQQQQGGGTS